MKNSTVNSRRYFQRLIFQLYFVFLAVKCFTAAAAPGDGHWDRQFAMPGAANGQLALRIINGTIYAGGISSVAGLTAPSTVANVFDGTNWSVFGDFNASSTNGLAALLDFAQYKNELYIGGLFNDAAGVPASGLVRWNGTDWLPVPGFAGAAFSMTSDGTNLFVGGGFGTNANGAAITNVAKWDGTNWSNLGNGLGNSNGTVNVVAWNNGVLYAGGNFTNSGGSAMSGVAYWNGSSWTALGGGVNGTVAGIAFQGTDIYVGGQFTLAGGTTSVLNIAKWNGTSWSALGSDLKGPSSSRPVNDLAFMGPDLCVGGNFTNAGGLTQSYLAKWNGSAWSSIGTVNGSVTHLVSTNGSLYIGGSFDLAGGNVANHIARWDGATWWPVTAKPANGTHIFVQTLDYANDGLYVGGSFSVVSNIPSSRVARFDGTNWHGLENGVSGITSPAVRAIKHDGSDVFVGGTFTTAGSVTANNIARWDGTWHSLGFGPDNTVSAIETYSGVVFAGGAFTNVYDSPGSGYTANHIAVWDPQAGWYSLGLGVTPSAGVAAISFQVSGLYIGGSFTNAINYSGSVTANHIAVWDGSNWSTLGSGLNGNVNSMLFDGNTMYVGGTFTTAGGVTARAIAKWDGSSWSAVGTGMLYSGTANVVSLAKAGAYLYAGGVFTNAGGATARGLARWDGTKWEALGSGIGNESPAPRASALAVNGNDVYIGGIFETVGNFIDAGYLARWNDQIDFTPTPVLTLSRATALSGNRFTFHAAATARANYAIEGTANFSSWNPIITTDAPRLDITNSTSAPYQFYRMREVP